MPTATENLTQYLRPAKRADGGLFVERDGHRLVRVHKAPLRAANASGVSWETLRRYLEERPKQRCNPPTINVFEQNDEGYIVQEASVGEPLNVLYRDWATSAMFLPIVAALQHSHSLGIFHGDVGSHLMLYASGLHLTGLGVPRAAVSEDAVAVARALQRCGGEGCKRVAEALERKSISWKEAWTQLDQLYRPNVAGFLDTALRSPGFKGLDAAFITCVFYDAAASEKFVTEAEQALRALLSEPLEFHTRGMMATFPVGKLLEPLRTNASEMVRVNALRVFEYAAQADTAPALVQSLSDKSALVRATARRALKRIWPPVALKTEGTTITHCTHGWLAAKEDGTSPGRYCASCASRVLRVEDLPPEKTRTLTVETPSGRVKLAPGNSTLLFGGIAGADIAIEDKGLLSGVLENVAGEPVVWSVEGGLVHKVKRDFQVRRDWVHLQEGESADVGNATILRTEAQELHVVQ